MATANLSTHTTSSKLDDLLAREAREDGDDLRAARGIWHWVAIGLLAWAIAGLVLAL